MKTTMNDQIRANALARFLAAGLICLWFLPGSASAQQNLSLKEALKISIENYGTIKAKEKYAAASKASVQQSRLDYLPNVNLSAQTDYGTVSGQNGPSYAFGSPGFTSSGPALAQQNWNAAFGALYLTNINWDFFSFGRSKERIKTAQMVASRDNNDTQQEIFQHEIRVSAAYLNLLAAQRLTASYQKNLDRADTLRNIIVLKAKHDLVAGVDSSQANAEVSNAKSTLMKMMNAEDEQSKNLIQFLGINPQKLNIDTFFISRLPAAIPSSPDSVSPQHPVLQYYKSRISVSEEQAKYYHTLNYPTFSLGGVLQTRGSGFSNSYASNQNNYTGNLWQGIKPDRSNYLVALGVTWNIIQPLRIKQQVKAQRLSTEGLKDEMNLTRQQLTAQLDLSEKRIKNAIADYYETPFQVKAATDAYHQKEILYRNGLTSLVDVTQALYALVRAETDRDIAFNNVWQALLLKAASSGDFSTFYKNL
ncbi:Outer membrane protein TolC [Pedobacter westerhofensis]|uniref:Outer membrane protein TolC n=1 Tax=Pedobacter westerhofensis TaxID=425512 RepID=A0A521BQH1_9SPHI|nr:TolC family protein [Pedobacter westerhofensis]SMO49349.1 Outer membrane protein TolC [Pedobacter westerhofensis]